MRDMSIFWYDMCEKAARHDKPSVIIAV